MDKEAILAEARRRYPLGTIHRGGSSDKGSSFTVTAELEYRDTGGTKDNILPRGATGCVYCTNTNYWAEIISLPEEYKVPDTIINDYQIY